MKKLDSLMRAQIEYGGATFIYWNDLKKYQSGRKVNHNLIELENGTRLHIINIEGQEDVNPNKWNVTVTNPNFFTRTILKDSHVSQINDLELLKLINKLNEQNIMWDLRTD